MHNSTSEDGDEFMSNSKIKYANNAASLFRAVVLWEKAAVSVQPSMLGCDCEISIIIGMISYLWLWDCATTFQVCMWSCMLQKQQVQTKNDVLLFKADSLRFTFHDQICVTFSAVFLTRANDNNITLLYRKHSATFTSHTYFWIYCN